MQYAIYAYERGLLVLDNKKPESAYLCVTGEREGLQAALDKYACLTAFGVYEVKKTDAWLDAILNEDELKQAFECHNAIQDFKVKASRFLEANRGN